MEHDIAAQSPAGDRPNALVILAHPAAGSFNHALAAAIAECWTAAGASVIVHDLCAEGFDPLLTAQESRGQPSADPSVLRHIEQLRSADLLAIVHPNFWGAPPAILKGWIDRVFAPNAAYTFAKGVDQGDEPIGLLRVRSALVINTGNTPLEREHGHFGDPLEKIWTECILKYCGVPDVTRRLFGVMATSQEHERRQWLDETRRLALAAVSRTPDL